MRFTKTKLVLLFFAFGFSLHFITRFLLNQPLRAIGASPNQEAWQRLASTILSPIQLVLFAPVNWLQQDPDPPPPLRLIVCAVYWAMLALGIHQLLSLSRARTQS